MPPPYPNGDCDPWSTSMTMLLLAFGLAALYAGAEALVRGSASLALRAGVPPLVVGLTVVAFGTSAPELVVSVGAALEGRGDIAVGNVVGSNVFNVAAILGVSALLHPMRVQAQLVRLDVPVMIGASVLALLVFHDGRLERPAAALLVAGIVAYTTLNVVMARRERSRAVEREMREGVPPRHRRLALDLLLVAGGLGLLLAGARAFVAAAIDVARLWGVGEAVIALTVVAAGTSLPELATSVVAALRRQDDIAIGNVVGSNVFNVLGILGAAGLVAPLDAGGVGTVDFALMIGTALLLLPLVRTGFVVSRQEGGLLLAVYAGYLAWLWPTAG